MITQDTSINNEANFQVERKIQPESTSISTRQATVEQSQYNSANNYKLARALARPESALAVQNQSPGVLVSQQPGDLVTDLTNHVSSAANSVVKNITGAGHDLGTSLRGLIDNSSESGTMKTLISFAAPLMHILAIPNYMAAFQDVLKGKPIQAVSNMIKGLVLNMGAGDTRNLVNAKSAEETKGALTSLVLKLVPLGMLEFAQQIDRGQGRSLRYTSKRFQSGYNHILSTVFTPIQQLLKGAFMGRDKLYNGEFAFTNNTQENPKG